MLILGIDIGGTHIKADLYDRQGDAQHIVLEVNTRIDLQKGTNAIVSQVCDMISQYQAKFKIDGIAISTAGVVDNQSGTIVFAGPTIPAYTGTELKKQLEERFSLPVTVENDVNSAALAELWLGNATSKTSAFMITIGTGIGGALIVNGNIVTGHQFTAGEVGYLPVKEKRWETLASTSALVKMYEEETHLTNQTGKTFFKAFDNHEPIAMAVFETFLDHLAEGIAIISYLVNPEVFIIGGGIMARSEIILPKLHEKLRLKMYDTRFLPGQIVAAKLGNEAGRLGAVKHFLNTYEK